ARDGGRVRRLASASVYGDAGSHVEGLPGHRNVHRLPTGLSLPLLLLSADLSLRYLPMGRCLRVGPLLARSSARRSPHPPVAFLSIPPKRASPHPYHPSQCLHPR